MIVGTDIERAIDRVSRPQVLVINTTEEWRKMVYNRIKTQFENRIENSFWGKEYASIQVTDGPHFVFMKISRIRGQKVDFVISENFHGDEHNPYSLDDNYIRYSCLVGNYMITSFDRGPKDDEELFCF